MMRWMESSRINAAYLLERATMAQLQAITGYAKGLIDAKGYPEPRKTKTDLIALFQRLLLDEAFKTKFYQRLCTTPESKELYFLLLWKQKELGIEEVEDRFSVDLENTKRANYGYDLNKLSGAFELILVSGRWSRKKVFIDERIRPILKLIHPLPDDYGLKVVQEPKQTQYDYNNEGGVLRVISTIEDMLKTDLIEFGKTGERPLAKSLKILKSTTSSREFYSVKKMDMLSIDMLTRSFYFYHLKYKKFKKNPQETLKDFVHLQLQDKFHFTISRAFLTHLRAIRYGKYSDEQMELFDIVKEIIAMMPKDGWIDMDNIINRCNYQDDRIDINSHYETGRYYMEVDENKKHSWYNKIHAEDDHYNAIFFEPILKAMFFYLGALGVMELRYDDPISPYKIKAKARAYISVWDSLRYIRLTELGKYVFDYSEDYKAKEIVKQESKLRFDEYKPIITVEKSDSIMLAKLEPYTEKYEDNRYILSYGKIFRDCHSYKVLELKIDAFYALFDAPLPLVFTEHLDEIKSKADLLKRDLTQVVIELKNDKKLLDLFMTNKKLREIAIKAEGHRVVVSKKDLPQLTRIVKESGFFVEF